MHRRAVHAVRKTLASSAVAVFAVTLFGVATPAGATTYSNTATITINDVAAATPYPASISVPAGGSIDDVNVTLTGITHSSPSDIDILLVGPTGKDVILMAKNGLSAISGVNLTFDDEATATLPGYLMGNITSGAYRPTTGAPASMPAPAPAAPFGSTLSVFDGTDPGGTWKLFVDDHVLHDTGTISGGWSLNITLASLSSFAPGKGKVGDDAVLTGVGFTGATTVRFGGTLASTFTVDSDTQITATVPAGASTGPISVTTPTFGTLTSPSEFVVVHDRKISINLHGTKAIGDVNVTDGYTTCGQNVPVKVQHLEHGKWKTVAGVLTKADGSYKAIGLQDQGKYRAVAKHATVGSGNVCSRATSPTVKH